MLHDGVQGSKSDSFIIRHLPDRDHGQKGLMFLAGRVILFQNVWLPGHHPGPAGNRQQEKAEGMS